MNTDRTMNAMNLDPKICYDALCSHDSRFDGRFFVAVVTTGIYCRPICKARTPRSRNCRFYRTHAEAERAGFRPCLLCRPEAAPGRSLVEASSRLAADAADMINDGALDNGGSMEDVARALGISGRHLRRVVERELGVTPVELEQTRRLLIARRLLVETDLAVTDVALSSGFSSLRRLDATFRKSYGMAPSELRHSRRVGMTSRCLTCHLTYLPPLDWNETLRFLGSRTSCGVESVELTESIYSRSAEVNGHPGWFSVSHDEQNHTLIVEIHGELVCCITQVLSGVRRMFDLSLRPDVVAAHLGPLAENNPGLRLIGGFDPFEAAIRAILGQQISVRAATTLSGRISAKFGKHIESSVEGLAYTAPDAARMASISIEELTTLGLTRSRAATVLAMSRAVADSTLSLKPLGDINTLVNGLKAIPGIGEWTAQVIAMRSVGWPDAFPYNDLGIKKAVAGMAAEDFKQNLESWRPWRSYAALHLWKSLEHSLENDGV